MGDDERRPVEVADDVGHGERLAGAGDAEQCLVFFAGQQSGSQSLDGLGLIPGGVEE